MLAAAPLMAIASLIVEDAGKALLCTNLTYLLWLLHHPRQEPAGPGKAQFSTKAAESHEDERSNGN